MCIYDPDIVDDYCHVKYTIYYLIVKEWMDAFGRDQVFVMNSNTYYADRVPIVRNVIKFLDLPPLNEATYRKIQEKKISNRKRHSSKLISSDTAAQLYNFLEPWSHKLADLLKDNSFLWRDSIHKM